MTPIALGAYPMVEEKIDLIAIYMSLVIYHDFRC